MEERRRERREKERKEVERSEADGYAQFTFLSTTSSSVVHRAPKLRDSSWRGGMVEALLQGWLRRRMMQWREGAWFVGCGIMRALARRRPLADWPDSKVLEMMVRGRYGVREGSISLSSIKEIRLEFILTPGDMDTSRSR
jgi:hypothetical protein